MTHVDDEVVENEIEQADLFNERIQQTVIHLERLITAKSSPPSHTSIPPTIAPPISTAATVSSIEAGVSLTHTRVIEASTSKVKFSLRNSMVI